MALHRSHSRRREPHAGAMSSPAWIVIDAMVAEIEAQMQCGSNGRCITVCDQQGRIHINGTIDLPALAVATQATLREAYLAEESEK